MIEVQQVFNNRKMLLKRLLPVLGLAVASMLLWGCSAGQPQPDFAQSPSESVQTGEPKQVPETSLATVMSVQVTGNPDAYQFSVEVSSPDEGCDMYADWWEVLTDDGELVYRRILTHSHVNEQPFIRSGGPVAIGPDTVVFVRAHMHPGGYGGAVLRGSVSGGFAAVAVETGFAAGLENEPPLPTGCDF